MKIAQLIILILSTTLIATKLKLKIQPGKSIDIENPFYFEFAERCKFKNIPTEGKVFIQSTSSEQFIVDSQEVNSYTIEKTSLRKKYRFQIKVKSGVTIRNLSDNEVEIKCTLKNSKKTLLSDLNNLNNFKEGLIKFEFDPNIPFELSNPLWIGISGHCAITTEGEQAGFGKMLKGKGKLNGENVPDAGLHLTFKTGDNLELWGGPLCKVQLLNEGTATIYADCDLGNQIKEKIDEVQSLLNMLGEFKSFFNKMDEIALLKLKSQDNEDVNEIINLLK